jgi:hypothetical protein
MKDLGVVELRAGVPKRVHVGAGKDCTFTATVLTNGLVRLNLLYEWKHEVIDGVKTQSHSERSFVLRPGRIARNRTEAEILGWNCFTLPPVPRPDLPRRGEHLVVAMKPIIIP